MGSPQVPSAFTKVRRHAASGGLVVFMTFVSTFPTMKPVLPSLAWLSIDTRIGTAAYVGSMVLLAVLVVAVMVREGERRDREERDRDGAIERLRNEQREGFDSLARLFKASDSVVGGVEKNGLDGTPITRIVEATGRAAGRTLVAGSGGFKISGSGSPEFKVELRGTARATPARLLGTLTFKQVDEATELLEEIAQDPPKTAEAVQKAADQLKIVIGIAEETDQVLAITPTKTTDQQKLPPWFGADDELPSQQPPITPPASDNEAPPSKEAAP